MTEAVANIFPQIYNVINNNPNRSFTLRRGTKTTTQGSIHQTWDNFILKPMVPPGPLSILLYNTDSMFAVGSTALRKQILTETLLELQTRAEYEIVGRRFPRKKIQDLLAEQVSANETAPPSKPMLEEVLCELFHAQKVMLDKKNKTISFYPPDIRNWSTERPIILSDTEGCWIYEADQPISLLPWLTEKENQHWKIMWPVCDGKMEDLKTALDKRNITAHPADGALGHKVKKEDFARTLGKAEAIDILQKLHLVFQ